MGKFVVKKTATGFNFTLKATNGQPIANSEVYSSKSACLNGIESVKKNSVKANLEDQTVEGYATEKNPKFEIYTDKKGEFRFRLKATNGEIIATGEGYTTKPNCLKGVESIRKNAPEAPVEEE